MLRPGAFIRLKQPVVSFVSTEELFLLASVNQRAAQWIRSGDQAQFALSMYPGRVFQAEVDQVVWATGRSQLQVTGILPREPGASDSQDRDPVRKPAQLSLQSVLRIRVGLRSNIQAGPGRYAGASILILPTNSV